jgi:hypothetical protein
MVSYGTAGKKCAENILYGVKVMFRISRGLPKVVMRELYIVLLQKLNELKFILHLTCPSQVHSTKFILFY